MEDLRELYENVVLDHYRNPRNSTALSEPDGSKKLYNPFCGDEVQIEFKGTQNLDLIAVISRGCAISCASGSIMGDVVKGRSHAEALRLITNARNYIKGVQLTSAELDELDDFEAMGGVRNFPVRIKCALLSWTALEELLDG